MIGRLLTPSAGLLFCASAVPALAANATSFVSSSGRDTNPCTRAAPCATLQAAYAATDAAGEIDCVDTANYGGLDIRHSITINCVGAHATTDEIDIEPTGANFNVVLEGLDVNGRQANGTGWPYGIQVVGTGGHITVRHSKLQGAFWAMDLNFQGDISVDLDDVDMDDRDTTDLPGVTNGGLIISGLSGTAHVDVRNSRILGLSQGIYVTANSPTWLTIDDSEISKSGLGLYDDDSGLLKLNVRNSRILGTGSDGVRLTAPAQAVFENSEISGGSNGIALVSGSRSPAIAAMIRGTTISNNSGSGILATGTGARAVVTRSTITQNATGASAQSGATIYSAGNNDLVMNGTNGTFTGTATQQ